jgi:hypothetical protein
MYLYTSLDRTSNDFGFLDFVIFFCGFGLTFIRAVVVVPRLICRQGECVGKDAGNTVKFVQMIGVGDGCGPCNRMAGECYYISLWKWGLGSDRILYKKAGHTRETICPQLSGAQHPETPSLL